MNKANEKTVASSITVDESATSEWRDPVIEMYKKDVDRTLLRENLKLTVAERFRKFQSFVEYAKELLATAHRTPSSR